MNQTALFHSCTMQLTLPFSIMIRSGEKKDLTVQKNIDHAVIQLYKGPVTGERACDLHHHLYYVTLFMA